MEGLLGVLPDSGKVAAQPAKLAASTSSISTNASLTGGGSAQRFVHAALARSLHAVGLLRGCDALGVDFMLQLQFSVAVPEGPVGDVPEHHDEGNSRPLVLGELVGDGGDFGDHASTSFARAHSAKRSG